MVSTTTQWGATAEETIREQSVPVRRLGLEDFEQSRVDWATFDPETPTALSLSGASDLRPYQRTAIDDVIAGFENAERGRLIMACGTGKTFTSLRLTEAYVGARQRAVPGAVDGRSVQALREWSNNTSEGITAMAVCSDTKASRGRKASEDSSEISMVDLALPATTDPERLAARMKEAVPMDRGFGSCSRPTSRSTSSRRHSRSPDWSLSTSLYAMRRTAPPAPPLLAPRSPPLCACMTTTT